MAPADARRCPLEGATFCLFQRALSHCRAPADLVDALRVCYLTPAGRCPAGRDPRPVARRQLALSWGVDAQFADLDGKIDHIIDKLEGMKIEGVAEIES